MSIFSAIGHGFKVFFSDVAHAFVTLFGRDAAAKFASSALTVLKSELGKVVLAECAALMSLPIDGPAKQLKAQEAVLAKAKEAGIDVTTSVVNLLIELAVQFLKGVFPDDGTQPTV